MKDIAYIASSLPRRLEKRVSPGLEKTILIKEDEKPNRPILTTNKKLELKDRIIAKIIRVKGLKTLPKGSQISIVLIGGEIL